MITRSFPQQLVDAVAEGTGVAVTTALRMLQVLADEPGVTLPQVEEQKPEWWSTGAVVLSNRRYRSTRVTVEDDDGDDPLGVYARMAEDIAGHLNGDCTGPYLQLVAAARVAVDMWETGTPVRGADVHPLERLRDALAAVDDAEETGDG